MVEKQRSRKQSNSQTAMIDTNSGNSQDAYAGSSIVSIPTVREVGTTSAPLKSAAFFIGAFCKDVNGMAVSFISHVF